MSSASAEDFNIRLGTDLEELVTLRPDWTMTTWDPKFFPDGEAFWLAVEADDDGAVAVVAARLFECVDIEEELKALRVFYLHPENFQDHCEVRLFPIQTKGKDKRLNAHTGNLWVAPAFRGQGLGGKLTRLLHEEILRRWDVDYIWGLMEKELACRGLWQDQAYPNCQGQVVWKCAHWGETFDMKIVWGTADEISRGLEADQ